MTTKIISKHECVVCNANYPIADEANKCELIPVSQDKGTKAGDIVVITHGFYRGERARVLNTFICSQNWYSKHNWHTIGIFVDILGYDRGISLSYDEYKLEREKK